jgi:hypothetical protein
MRLLAFWIAKEINEGYRVNRGRSYCRGNSTTCRDVTFETLQLMFQEWMEQSAWVIDKNGGAYFG